MQLGIGFLHVKKKKWSAERWITMSKGKLVIDFPFQFGTIGDLLYILHHVLYKKYECLIMNTSFYIQNTQ